MTKDISTSPASAVFRNEPQAGRMAGFRRAPWEARLLEGRLGGAYRLLVQVCSGAFLSCVRTFPDAAATRWMWRRLGERFLFRRGYSRIAAAQDGSRFLCSLHDIIQRFIMAFGLWEPNTTEYFRRSLKPGDGLLDIGANIGYFTLIGSRLVGPDGMVVAIEANPYTHKLLDDNIQRNGASNIRAVQCAVLGEPGRVAIYSGGLENLGATTIVADRGQEIVDWVEGRPLDMIVGPEEFARVRLVKIDVEGAEVPVLKTLLQQVAAMREDVEIIVELNPGAETDSLIAEFAAKGFHAYGVVNDYSVDAYVPRRPACPPVRLRAPVARQTDIVLSRRDVEALF